jgi:hypothetical protein
MRERLTPGSNSYETGRARRRDKEKHGHFSSHLKDTERDLRPAGECKCSVQSELQYHQRQRKFILVLLSENLLVPWEAVPMPGEVHQCINICNIDRDCDIYVRGHIVRSLLYVNSVCKYCSRCYHFINSDKLTSESIYLPWS